MYGAAPDVDAFDRIELRVTTIAGDYAGEWYELTFDATGIHYEAYALAEAIVDEMASGSNFKESVAKSLNAMKELLVRRIKLSEEKITGLFGELLVLSHVILRDGEDAALGAWLGPQAEEHDFSFPQFDAEVKTTRSERRAHMIASETQLEPSPGRPLYLISLQITRAGDADGGQALPALIAETRSSLTEGLGPFNAALDSLGWRDADEELYRVAYRLRSGPRAYLVDSAFPAITSPRLNASIPQPHRLSNVSYSVDLTQLQQNSATSPLDDFCEEST